MTTPVSIPVYTQGFGTAFTGSPFVTSNNPGSTNIDGPNGTFKIGQVWINITNNSYWGLTSFSSLGGAITANWEELSPSSSSEVLSLMGTAHQIAVSSPTGDVTVSLTNGISLGSYQATVPPVGGMLIPGEVAIGTSSTNLNTLLNISQVTPYGILIDGTSTQVDGSNTNYGVVIDNSVIPSADGASCYSFGSLEDFGAAEGNTISIAANFYGNHVSDTNAGTITTAAVFYADSGVSFVGSFGWAYGAYLKDQSTEGFSHMALYAENASIGNSTPSSNPPTKGLLVSGQAGFGTVTVNAAAAVEIDSTTQGFLPPVMTTDQKNAIASPPAGLVVYDSTLNNLAYYSGSAWVNLS